GVDVVLVVHSPTAITGSEAAADAVIVAMKQPGPPIITAWLGGNDAALARNRFTAAGIPAYATPEQALRAFMYLFRFRRNQEQLMETPPSYTEEIAPDTRAARAIVQRVIDE